MPPPTANRLKSTESQLGQASKEATPLPESLQSKKSPTSTNSSTFLSSRLLEETLNITLKYGDEYMDENPITGQPGEFHLSSTGRKEAGKLAVPATGGKGPLSTATKAPSAPSLKTTDDGLHGEEGTFLICSFWLVSALSEIGETERASTLCERLLAHASSLGLYAEELDAATGRHLGNFPQAFTHLALINATLHVISDEESS